MKINATLWAMLCVHLCRSCPKLFTAPEIASLRKAMCTISEISEAGLRWATSCCWGVRSACEANNCSSAQVTQRFLLNLFELVCTQRKMWPWSSCFSVRWQTIARRMRFWRCCPKRVVEWAGQCTMSDSWSVSCFCCLSQRLHIIYIHIRTYKIYTCWNWNVDICYVMCVFLYSIEPIWKVCRWVHLEGLSFQGVCI